MRALLGDAGARARPQDSPSSAKTQDEIGHAHLLYMVAADLGLKSRDEMLDDLFAGRTRFHNVFHYRTVTWADQIAIAYLVDAAALTTQQAVFKHCSYGPYRRDPEAHRGRGGLPHAPRRGDAADAGRGIADTAPRCSRRPSTGGGSR